MMMMMMTMTTTTTTTMMMIMMMVIIIIIRIYIYGPSRTFSSRYCSFYLKTAKLSPLLTILNLKALLDYKWYK